MKIKFPAISEHTYLLFGPSFYFTHEFIDLMQQLKPNGYVEKTILLLNINDVPEDRCNIQRTWSKSA